MLEGLARPKKVTQCGIRTLKETLSPEDAQILENAVMDREWSVNSLQDALQQKGLAVGYQLIYRHRNGICSCSRMEKTDA